MSKLQSTVRENLRVPGLVRDEVRDGTQFLVVPVVMLQEQILFCSNCHPDGEFISAREIMTSLMAWDNRPVTLSHPSQEWTPSNHQRLEIGRVFNTFWDGKLKAEMWLNLVDLKSTMEGREAEARLRAGEVTEVSTGYFVERVTKRGKFEGMSFGVQQIGIVPDHLAILTDEIGACSVAGGCGAPRLNSDGGDPMDEETKLLTRIAEFLLAKLGKRSTDGDAGDGGDGTAENKDGGDSSASATGDKDGGSGEDGSDGSGSSMDETARKDLVARLLTSKKVATFDEKALLAMSDEQLESLATLTGCECNTNGKGDAEGDDGTANNSSGSGDEGSKEGTDGDDGGDTGDAKPTQNADPAISAEDVKFVAELRAASGGSLEGLVSLMEAGKVEAERRKDLKTDLVVQLHKDSKVAMSENVLNSMSLEALEGLDRSLNPQSYAGRGGARLVENKGDDGFAPDAPPVILAALDQGDGDGDGGDS